MQRNAKIQAHATPDFKAWLEDEARRRGFPSASSFATHLMEQQALQLGCPPQACFSDLDPAHVGAPQQSFLESLMEKGRVVMQKGHLGIVA